MVAKINSGSSLFGALAYNQEKVNADEAKILFSNRIIQNSDGSYNMHNCMESFEPYLAANNKTEKPVLHISLNPHPDDKLTDEQLCDIAQEYMDKLGYGDQPYLVYKHEDLDRKHIHIVSVRVDENGRKIDDSFEKRRSKDITRELEQKYNLLPAEKKQYSQQLPLKRVKPKAGDIKKQVANIAKTLIGNYHFQSVNEYRALLSLYGVTVEEVKGEVRGKAYNGLVYSALNSKGEKAGNPFKSSLISRTVGFDALQKRITFSKKEMKNKAVYDRTKTLVTVTLSHNPSRKSFEKELAKNRISVLFRENEDKRIYGVTFIDHNEKMVFNGSKMGKEFSANVFNKHFNKQSDSKYIVDDKSIDKDYIPNSQEQESIIESAVGIFSMEQHGDDYEEIAFATRMKRRRKKTRGPN